MYFYKKYLLVQQIAAIHTNIYTLSLQFHGTLLLSSLHSLPSNIYLTSTLYPPRKDISLFVGLQKESQ